MYARPYKTKYIKLTQEQGAAVRSRYGKRAPAPLKNLYVMH